MFYKALARGHRFRWRFLPMTSPRTLRLACLCRVDAAEGRSVHGAHPSGSRQMKAWKASRSTSAMIQVKEPRFKQGQV